MVKKFTHAEFVDKAKTRHGDKYDYSMTVFENCMKKVTIMCPIHGEFEQRAWAHINGSGCKKCADAKIRFSTVDFVGKADEIHKNLYDYSCVKYKNNHIPILIKCKIHGNFSQIPSDHLNGSGCSKCKRVDKKNTSDFILRAKAIHKNKYDYSKVEYTNSITKVVIICHKHGEFAQRPVTHLCGCGCSKCSKSHKLNTESFILKAKKVHGGIFDYSKVKYKNCTTKVIIICRTHGEFHQKPSYHLGGSSCPQCVSSVSKLSQLWLDKIGIPESDREKFIRVSKSKYYIVDGLDKKNNTIYEFNGDFWHGNPEVYSPNDFNVVSKKSYKELFKATKRKRSDLEKLGYKVKSIWESEFKLIMFGKNKQ